MVCQDLILILGFVQIGYKTMENRYIWLGPGSSPLINYKMQAKEQINQSNLNFNTHKTHDTTSTVLSIGCITYISNTMVLPIL